MTEAMGGFMRLTPQLFAHDLSSALAALARQKYGTVGNLAKAWNIDKSTAANLFRGHLSVTTLAKAIAAEGGDLWDALGREVTGESYEQRQERRLQSIIREAENARQNLHVLRTRAALLDERARELGDAFSRPHDEPGRSGHGRNGSSHS
jgi:hypothetical protein